MTRPTDEVLERLGQSLREINPSSLHVDPERREARELDGHIVRMVRNSADPNGLWPYKLAIEFESPDPELVAIVLQSA